jgi:hypothetical protein
MLMCFIGTDMISRYFPKNRFPAFLPVCAILILTGCDNSFEPLMENDRYAFSMYGALDVHADTQWVRVMPIGDKLIPTDSVPSATEVRIINENTGEQFMLTDSLFRFGGEAYVLNYFTDVPIFPEETYRVTATAEDGRQSYSILRTPSELAVPDVDFNESLERLIITGSNSNPIVSVDIRYRVQTVTFGGCTPEAELVISNLKDVLTLPNGEYRINANNGSQLSQYRINSRDLVIVTGSEDWPDLQELNEEEMALPDVVSNVENGTGYIAGIARRYVMISPRLDPC